MSWIVCGLISVVCIYLLGGRVSKGEVQNITGHITIPAVDITGVIGHNIWLKSEDGRLVFFRVSRSQLKMLELQLSKAEVKNFGEISHDNLNRDTSNFEALIKISYENNIWGSAINPSFEVIKTGWIHRPK